MNSYTKQHRLTGLKKPSFKKQSGFIQNLIIPGILLIGAVIGIIALMTNSSGGKADKEQAALRAAGVLAQGITLKEAALRAYADGVTDLSDINVLISNGYITGNLPKAPTESQVTATNWAISVAYDAKDNQATPAHLGASSSKDDILILDDIQQDVCVRINNKLYGETVIKGSTTAAIYAAVGATPMSGSVITAPTVPTAYKTGTAEGCVPSATANKFVYYKVVNIK